MAITVVPRIYLSSDSMTVSSGSTTNTVSYSITSSVTGSTATAYTSNGSNWLHFSSIDKDKQEITFAVDANTGEERTGTITVQAKGKTTSGDITVSDYLTVIQIAKGEDTDKDGTITPQTNPVIIPTTGSSNGLTFTYNDIDADTLSIESDSSWLKITSTSTTAFHYSAEKNSGEFRSAKVTISAKNSLNSRYVSATVSFQQSAVAYRGSITFGDATVLGNTYPKSYIPIGNGEWKYGGDYTSFYIPYTTENVASIYNIYTKDLSGNTVDWVHIASPRSGQVTISGYDANGDTDPKRTCVVEIDAVSSIDGTILTDKAYIVQDAGEHWTTAKGVVTVGDGFSVGWRGGSGTTTYTLENCQVNRVRATTIDGVTVTINNTAYTVDVVVPENEETSELQIPVTIISEGDDRIEVSDTFIVIQEPRPETVEFPIWKDTEIGIESDNTYVDYIITVDDNTIYSGRAYMIDGSASVRMNDIMEDFLNETLDFEVEDAIQDNNAYINSVMQISYDDGATYIDYKFVKCYNDWSYDDSENNFLSDPINYVLDSRQYFLCSCIDYADALPTVLMSITATGSSKRTTTYRLTNQIGTLKKRIKDAKNITVSIGDNSKEYTVVDGCHKYCIYYKNARGGYDSLLFNGVCKRTDTSTLKTFKRNLLNTLVKHNKVQYKRVITPKWELNTDYLTDAQSDKMYNLTESTQAFLHDLEDDKLYPVNVTDTTHTWKNWRNNSRKFAQYKVTVELAQDRKIR